MTFKQLSIVFRDKFTEIQKNGKAVLLNTDLEKGVIGKTYLSAFKKGDDPVFRDPNRSEHDCDLDLYFLERYGNIIALYEGETTCIFDIDIPKDSIYHQPVKALKELVSSAEINDIFLTENFGFQKKGDFFLTNRDKTVKVYNEEEAVKHSPNVVEANKPYVFYHFHALLHKNYVDQNAATKKSKMRSSAEVLKRGIEDIPLYVLQDTLEFIHDGSLLDAERYIPTVKNFMGLVKESKDKDLTLFSFENADNPAAKFRNELIGTFCIEYQENSEKAQRDFNKRSSPDNYMKAKTLITEEQKKYTEKVIVKGGYAESLNRRFAKISDISPSDIYHRNHSKTKISLFGDLPAKSNKKQNPDNFKNIPSISVDEFMERLGDWKSVEALLTSHKNHLVYLHTADEGKSIFPYGNNFGHTYSNGASSTRLTENVSSQGGITSALLRFSIGWADGDNDKSDLDAYCEEPSRKTIYFSSPYVLNNNTIEHGNFSPCGGILDLDTRIPRADKPAVENIFYMDDSKLQPGKYRFFIENYRDKGSKGFTAEVKIGEEIYSYTYEKPLGQKERIMVAEVGYDGKNFSIEHYLKPKESNSKLWGLEANHFHPVNLICLSPNRWNDSKFGNTHYLFMLQDCLPDEELRLFNVDDLIPELKEKSVRRVLDMYAEKRKQKPEEGMLAGLGFPKGMGELIVKTTDHNSKNQIFKIKF